MDLAVRFPQLAAWLWTDEVRAKLNFENMAASGDYPVSTDLLAAVGISVVLTAMKYFLNYVMFKPMSIALLKIKHAELPLKNDQLELEYCRHKPKLPDINEIKALSTKLGLSVEAINKWLKVRQSNDRNKIKVERFSECIWRLILYTSVFCMGLSVCIGQKWWSDTRYCWKDFETHTVTGNLKIFYVYMQLPLYFHLLYLQLAQSKRSDFWEMFAHHVLVIILMTFSYLGNFVRIGCLALLCHDVTDLFIESAKVCKYLRRNGLCDMFFTGFAISWAFARLYKFPTVVVMSVIVEQSEENVIGPAYYTFLGLVSTLLALNLYWFKIIFEVCYRILWGGTNTSRGAREGTDMSTDDDIGDSDSSSFSDSFSEPLKHHED